MRFKDIHNGKVKPSEGENPRGLFVMQRRRDFSDWKF